MFSQITKRLFSNIATVATPCYKNIVSGKIEYKTSFVYAWDIKSEKQDKWYSTQYDFTSALNKRCQELSDEGWQIDHIIPFCNAHEHSSTTTHYVIVSKRSK